MRFTRSLAAVMLLALAATGCCFAKDNSLVPVATIRKLDSAQTAGKPIKEVIWNMPVSIPRFEYYVLGPLPTQQTEVRLAYDDANLYVAFRCIEDQMDMLKCDQTKRDASLNKDDSVSIMLDPGNTHRSYFHISANAAGVQSDSKGKAKWDGVWLVDTTKEKEAWTALFTIPFKTLGLDAPKVGKYWGVQLTRQDMPSLERSCWATVRPVLGEPELWGHCIFGDSKSVVASATMATGNMGAECAPCVDRAASTCQAPATPIAAPGKYPLVIRVSNPRSKPVRLRTDVVMDDDVVMDTQAKTIQPGESEWKLDVDFLYEGYHELKFAVYQSSKSPLMRTTKTQVYIHPCRTRIAYLKGLITGLKPASPALEQEKAAVEKALGALTAFAREAEGSKDKWAELGKRLRETEKTVGHLRAACADRAGKGYAVGAETALVKIMRDEMFEGKFGEPARMELARNEWESAQVVVIAQDRALKQVDVSVSALAGPGGAVIGKDRIKLNLVDWIEARPARYAADLLGWVPDPLMEMQPF